jgi:hypothetical protein
MIVSFASPFYPAPLFYTGSAAQNDVPFRFPVALNGRPYMLDLASNQFQRGFEPRLRDSVDQGEVPGEASITPEGMWRRSQVSWHYGAGQRWADGPESIPGRFYQSCGVDVWTDGELKLLPTMSGAESLSGNGVAISDGTRLYFTYGNTIKYTTSTFGTNTTITSAGAQPVTQAATNGNHTWFAQGTAGLYRAVIGSDAATQVITSTVSRVGFVRNRLLAAHEHQLYDVTSLAYGSAAALPTALFAHANTSFRWAGFAASGTHIYVGGVSGDRSVIYKITIAAEGTALGAPSVALELPPGEVLTALSDFPGGFILIGTARGPRLAQADGTGDLTVGALIDTGSPVRAFFSEGSFVWFTWETNHPSKRPGAGRMDLRRFTAPLTPAYASDTFLTDDSYATQSFVATSILKYKGKFVLGMYRASNTTILYTNGNYDSNGYIGFPSWLETGWFSWNIADPKIVTKVDVRADPIVSPDAVEVLVRFDEGNGYNTTFQPCSYAANVGESFLRYQPPQKSSFRSEFRIELSSGGNIAEQATVRRFNARAFITPPRSQVIRLPILLHHRINVDGLELDQDVQFELLTLRSLVASPRIVRYQEGFESFFVVVEDLLWIPRHERVQPGYWDGTAVVTLRTIEL